MSEEYKITAGTLSGATLKSIGIEPSIIVDGKSYTASEFNKAVEMLKQPQLNENQQIVLEWLKATWIDRKKNCWFPFEVINSLYYQFDVAWGKVSYEEFKRIEKDKPYIKAYGELTVLEQFEVLELFSKWAQKQEEE